jgi:hypothetical protein
MSETETKAPEAALPTVAQPGGSVVPMAALQKMAKAKHTDKFGAGELLLPWLSRVQGTSDFVKRNKPNYIPEAKVGDITDNLTLRLRAIQTVILVKFEVHYSTFKPGGGRLVHQWYTDRSGYDAASYPPGKDFGKKIDADGNEVIETPMYYALMIDNETGTADPCCINFGSTQAKKTRRINTLARADIVVPNEDGVHMPVTPPIYARLFDLTTIHEANDQNQWIGWVASVGELVLSHPKFGELWWAKAEAFREQIELGNVRPMPPDGSDDVDDAGGGSPRPGAAPRREPTTLDQDIPF